MLIKQWLSDFMDAHQERHPRSDWPEADSGDAKRLWSLWFDAFKPDGITHREAELASRRINGDGLEWHEDHVKAIVAMVGRIRDEDKTAPGVVRSAVSMSKEDREAEAACAIVEVEAMSPEERMTKADELLGEFYALGWEMRWIEDENQFRTYRSRPDAFPVDIRLSTRLRALKPEVYAQLGRPLPGWGEELPLDMDQFRDENGKFQWRLMVTALAARMEAT